MPYMQYIGEQASKNLKELKPVEVSPTTNTDSKDTSSGSRYELVVIDNLIHVERQNCWELFVREHSERDTIWDV